MKSRLVTAGVLSSTNEREASESCRVPIDPLLRGGAVEFHGPSPILGPDGQPYRRALTEDDKRLLGEEVAAPQLIGTRSLFDPCIASGLTPSHLGVLLRECVRGDCSAYLQLAEDMEERDLNYAAALGTRKRALSRIKPTLDVTGVEPRVAEAVRAVIEDDAFHSMIKDALDAIGKGFSVNEIIWCSRAGQWWPQGYRFRDPKYFTFDYLSRTELRLADNELIDGYELPPAKFIRHIPKMKSGLPIRGGLARTVAWAFMFKSFALKDWAAFLDTYGLPLRLGKYHPSATEDERRSLLRAVGQIASDAAAIIPESMSIEFIETKAYADKPFEAFAGYLDDAIATMVLGQTLTTRDGGSLGQAKVHNEIRLDFAEDDAFELGVTINRELIRPFVDLNFGADVRAPRCEFRIPKPEVVSVLATALGILVPLGLKVAQEDVRHRIGLPSPAEGAELLAGPSLTSPPSFGAPTGEDGMPGERAARALAALVPGGVLASPTRSDAASRKHCDLIAWGAARPAPAEVLDPIGLDAGAEWQAETGPMLDALMTAARRSASFDEFRQALRRLYPDLPTADVERRLAAADKADTAARKDDDA